MAPEEDSSKSPAPKAFSISLGSSKAKSSPLTRKPLTPSNGIKRPHSSLHDSDDEDDASQTPAEHVSTFDYTAGGAIGINGVKEKAPSLVIPNQKNRDWREESRRKRGRNLLPQEVQQASNVDSEKDVVNGAPQAFGLNFAPKAETGDTTTTGPGEGADRYRLAQEEPVKPKTDDELALEALMSNGEKRRSDMVLPAVMESGDTGRNPAGYGVSEDDAFKADVDSRPEAATLDQYAAVPVEEFGAALLRGMGWKEGDVVGKRKDQISKPRLVEKRPALLGLGAKEVPGGIGEGDELGAWGKASKGKRKVDKTYNPVLLKNQKTGEMVSEEELKGRIEDAKRAEKEEKEDWRDRRDRNLKIDKERKDRRHGDSRNTEKGTAIDQKDDEEIEIATTIAALDPAETLHQKEADDANEVDLLTADILLDGLVRGMTLMASPPVVIGTERKIGDAVGKSTMKMNAMDRGHRRLPRNEVTGRALIGLTEAMRNMIMILGKRIGEGARRSINTHTSICR
ncbi:MAG: 60S ribosomal protein L11 [Chaenotheca gracillima]|nr:MAG: 60S ribosomal protein L11 [Chaenotheca gracillima]